MGIYPATFSNVVRTVLHQEPDFIQYRNSYFLGEGWGGALIGRGRLLNIFSLRRGVYSKGSTYLKLGANWSIYGTSVCI